MANGPSGLDVAVAVVEEAAVSVAVPAEAPAPEQVPLLKNVKLTVPVGLAPVTVAMSLTRERLGTELPGLMAVTMVVVAWVTVSGSHALVEGALSASPL